MYTISLSRTFIAQRTDPDADQPRAHVYRAELMLEGENLDSQGYLIDLEEVAIQLEEAVAPFRDKHLNMRPEFEGENPSLERIARVLCHKIDETLYAPDVLAISIKLWEDDRIWAAYDLEREEA
ncbi:MAG: 6-carboxytetrahydropterin synthase [Chloroflexi bacterium]|nr:6-carboxytetrahydropterin synthase [Chloroflexota bacterium]